MNKRKIVETSSNDNDWFDDSSADFRKKSRLNTIVYLEKPEKSKKKST